MSSAELHSRKEHIDILLEAEGESQREYDKALLTLSGAAFGISFAFLNDIVPIELVKSMTWALVAWGCWASSLALTFVSLGTSTLAYRKAIKQVRSDVFVGLGGGWKYLTSCLNVIAGAAFVSGLISLIVFIAQNTP